MERNYVEEFQELQKKETEIVSKKLELAYELGRAAGAAELAKALKFTHEEAESQRKGARP